MRHNEDSGHPVWQPVVGLGSGIRTYDNAAAFAHFCTRRRCQIRMFDGLAIFLRLLARRSLFDPFPSCLFPGQPAPCILTEFCCSSVAVPVSDVKSISFRMFVVIHELLLDVQTSAADKNAEMMLKLSLNQMEAIKGREGFTGKDADRATSAVKLAAGGQLEEEVIVCTYESIAKREYIDCFGPI